MSWAAPSEHLLLCRCCIARVGRLLHNLVTKEGYPASRGDTTLPQRYCTADDPHPTWTLCLCALDRTLW